MKLLCKAYPQYHSHPDDRGKWSLWSGGGQREGKVRKGIIFVLFKIVQRKIILSIR